jgi:large subunit ribosomal protein L10
MAILTKKIPDWKVRQINETAEKMKTFNTVALVDIKGLPASQFHTLRSKLRNSLDIKVVKKIIIQFALEHAKSNRHGLEKLNESIGDMPALIFSELGPFQISKLLLENRVPAFAKAGDIAPTDIAIEEGPTPFTPGPMISELSALGLKVKVEAGKIVIQKRSVVAKKGEAIKQEVADLLVKLSIKPLEVGLDLSGAWENSFIFNKNILKFNIKDYLAKLSSAAGEAFNLSLGLPYPLKENISILISKAYNDAKAVALGKDIFVDALVPALLTKATAQASELGKYVESKKV